jgi:DNA-binding NarL/FixJ family response regulator
LVRDRQPDLVVIDSNLPIDDVRVFLEHIQQEGLPIRSLVLGATNRQVQRALAAGADVALRRDTSTARLGAAMVGLYRVRPAAHLDSTDTNP